MTETEKLAVGKSVREIRHNLIQPNKTVVVLVQLPLVTDHRLQVRIGFLFVCNSNRTKVNKLENEAEIV